MTPCVFFTQADIDAWITEDAPLIDLTSHALGLDNQASRLTIVTRADIVAACTEEAARVVERCGGSLINRVSSGTHVSAGKPLLDAEGPAHALLRAWKVAQNLLEYACGVATATHHLVASVRSESANCAVLTTRKHPPGLKRLGLKATLAGGAMPHRLGLGETLLVFPQHRALLDDWATLGKRITAMGNGLCEKKLVIEAETLEQAHAAIAVGAEAIQFDKASPEQLVSWCHQLRLEHPTLTLLAAGGIHAGNAPAYARSGVDALVTSSLYQAPAADLGVQLCRTGAALDP